MDEKELSKYYYLKKEIVDLENRIIEFGDGVKSMQINDISVSSSHSGKSIQEKRLELISLWMEKRITALEECIRIERYINEVDDPVIRQIMRLRHIDCQSWSYIDTKLGYAPDSARKTYYRYRNK